MKEVLGAVLIGAGILAMIYGLTASGAAPGGTTLNLGLLVDKIVITLIGSTLMISGTLIVLSRKSVP